MNAEEFQRFEALPNDERQAIFEISAARLGILGTNVEKDYWVCRVLGVMMKMRPYAPKRFFKGGTSLSKGFGLIERFSEDIDVVLARSGLLRGDPDPFDPSVEFPSNKKRKVAQDELFKRASDYVYGSLADNLIEHIPDATIEEDRSKPRQPTLLIWYGSVFPQVGGPIPEYNKRRVKIETGPRGAIEPTIDKPILPYVQDDLGAQFDLRVLRVTMIRPERTFLEKASAIHSMIRKYQDDGTLPASENPPTRHLYDVAMMMDQQDVRTRATTNHALFADVCSHTQATFPSPYTPEIEQGQIALTPPAGLLPALEQDYERMTGMMYGEVPTLEWIIEKLVDAQIRLRALAAQ